MKKKYYISFAFLILFIVFTILVKTIDVQAIGPNGSMIGFASVNQAFFCAFSGNAFCYFLTELLGYAAILVIGCFALYGLISLIREKSLAKVNPVIYALAATYAIVLGAYVIFEKLCINARPILEDGELAASYPSSHTMLIVSVFATASIALGALLDKDNKLNKLARIACLLVIIAATFGRLFAGVHWLTDIVGSLLFSAFVILLFKATVEVIQKKISE